MRNLKRLTYHVCKWIGCFSLSRKFTRHGLRILAYHGSVLCHEDCFKPNLFMDVALFRQRMEYILAKGYAVLPLDKAVTYLGQNKLPAYSTVITFDDGFYSTWKKAVPILRELELPATIYITTYYCVKGNPVFRLVVQYMFWKTTVTELDLADFGLEPNERVRFADKESRYQLTWRIIDHAETHMDEQERVRLAEELGNRLGVEYEEIVQKRFLSLMTVNEIREAADAGVDIQLHTHRHCLPLEPDLVRNEIEQNRDVIEPLTRRKPQHFCYPKGIHATEHLKPLAESDVVSGTTCESGFNYSATPPLLLMRFLDGNNISWIEFEAEMSGFAELLRKIRSWLRAGRAA